MLGEHACLRAESWAGCGSRGLACCRQASALQGSDASQEDAKRPDGNPRTGRLPVLPCVFPEKARTVPETLLLPCRMAGIRASFLCAIWFLGFLVVSHFCIFFSCFQACAEPALTSFLFPVRHRAQVFPCSSSWLTVFWMLSCNTLIFIFVRGNAGSIPAFFYA